MKIRKRKHDQEVNTGSMADIAFLLLIFFLVATTLLQEKGLDLQLPRKKEDNSTSPPIKERNLFKVMVNSRQEILIEGEYRKDLVGLRDEIKAFVLNNGKQEHLSESPKKATISLKTSRGTKYASFIQVLDELKAAYFEIYAENIGLTKKEYLKLKQSDPQQNQLYLKSKEGIPMNISIAEPTI
ncbi:biopolymer transporter ExbD [Reichenbachiella sp. MALMAid0571]|uniref:ExbD/TolR family protein n=1 Tax=Reichenbachiella sp. MALMAid0571 TaxID=3143939 RepID=UPI0032E0214C